MSTSKKLLLFMCVIGMVILNSCTKDNNTNTDDVRSKYVATWTCTEAGGMIPYPVTITLDSSNSTQVLLRNFHFLGASAKAYAIATTSSLTLPSQDICGNTINGGGTLVNADKINMLYYVNNHSTVDTVHATYTK